MKQYKKNHKQFLFSVRVYNIFKRRTFIIDNNSEMPFSF